MGVLHIEFGHHDRVVSCQPLCVQFKYYVHTCLIRVSFVISSLFPQDLFFNENCNKISNEFQIVIFFCFMIVIVFNVLLSVQCHFLNTHNPKHLNKNIVSDKLLLPVTE